MQFDLLPQNTTLSGVRFEWMLDPSSYIGGDTFDYFKIDEYHVAFYIADVSGHGIDASMLAFTAHTSLIPTPVQIAPILSQHQYNLSKTVQHVVAEINQRFISMKDTGRYMTMIFGIIDSRSGKLSLTQAGHPHPIILRASGEPAHTLGEGGMPIGMFKMEADDIEIIETNLSQKDRLYLYSDGVTECEDPTGKQFGIERLFKSLYGSHDIPLDEAIQIIQGELFEWRVSDKPEDDITILALEFLA